MKAFPLQFSILTIVVCALHAAPGDTDPSFNAAASISYRFLQPVSDGIVVADSTVLEKFDLSGARDASFTAPTQIGTSEYVSALAADQNENLLVATYTSLAGTNFVDRLLPSGSVDPEFTRAIANNTVSEILELPDRDILIVGQFTAVNGIPRAGVASLNPNGEVDAAFAGPATRLAEHVALAGSGDYLVSDIGVLHHIAPDGTSKPWKQYGDSISFFAGELLATPDGGTWVDAAFNSAQILSDGAVDRSYQNNLWPRARAVTVLPDGRILMFGTDSTQNLKTRVARLFADGREDFSFRSLTNTSITAIAAGPNDTAYISGASDPTHSPSLWRVLLQDNSASSKLQFNRQRAAIGEGNVVPITIIRDGDASTTSSVRIVTSPSSALNEVDFAPTNIVVSFGAGERIRIVNIATIAHGGMQSDREFTVSMSETVGGVIGENSTLTVTILDRESAVSPSAPSRVYSEMGGRIQYFFNRVGSLAYPAPVHWRLEPVDPETSNPFVTLEGDTQFAALENQAFFDLRVRDDTLVNSNRNFRLILSSPDPNLAIELTNEVLITITDNDRPNDPGRGVDDTITAAELYADGRLALGGNFLFVNGEQRPKIARLLSTGEVDPTFTPPLFEPLDATITDLAVVAENKLAVLGSFTNVAGQPRRYMVRLNEDGTLDESFDATASLPRPAASFATRTNGGFYVLGNNYDYNGVRATTNNGFITRTNLGSVVRLDSAGNNDTNFTTSIVNGNGGFIAALPDDKFVVAGDLRVYRDPIRNTSNPGPTVRTYLARHLPNGAVDTGFTATIAPGFTPPPSPNTPLVRSLSVDAEGDVLVTGTFATANGASVRSIVRFNSNGSTDQPFTSNAGNQVGSSGTFLQGVFGTAGRVHLVAADRNIRNVYSLVAQADGTRDVAFGSFLDSSFEAQKSFWAVAQDGTSVLVNNYQRLLWFYPSGMPALNANLGLSAPLFEGNNVQLRVDVRTEGTLLIEESADLREWREVYNETATPGLQTVGLPEESAEHRFFRATIR